jgi:hypothetical protein
MLYSIQVHFPRVQSWVGFLGFTGINFISRLEYGSSACTFYLAFINMIINSDSRFNHFGQILRLIYLANFVLNGILEAIIELGRDNVTFLI